MRNLTRRLSVLERRLLLGYPGDPLPIRLLAGLFFDDAILNEIVHCRLAMMRHQPPASEHDIA